MYCPEISKPSTMLIEKYNLSTNYLCHVRLKLCLIFFIDGDWVLLVSCIMCSIYKIVFSHDISELLKLMGYVHYFD